MANTPAAFTVAAFMSLPPQRQREAAPPPALHVCDAAARLVCAEQVAQFDGPQHKAAKAGRPKAGAPKNNAAAKAALVSFHTHAIERRTATQKPGMSVEGADRYVSILAGLVMMGAVLPGDEEAVLYRFMQSTYRQQWADQATPNKCHTDGCLNPLRMVGKNAQTEVMGGMRNVLFAVEELFLDGEGVDLKLLLDHVCSVGPGRTTQFLCTVCNPPGGQGGMTKTDKRSVAARPALKLRFRLGA
jgi:hypothetical protein